MSFGEHVAVVVTQRRTDVKLFREPGKHRLHACVRQQLLIALSPLLRTPCEVALAVEEHTQCSSFEHRHVRSVWHDE